VTPSPTGVGPAAETPPVSPSPTLTPLTQVPTPTVTPTPCAPPPPGWTLYTVEPGDTLFSLASLAGVSQESVMQANCLTSPELLAGQQIYLPPLLALTPTPCVVSPPLGWILYTVRLGDTLFSLATTRGTTTDSVIQVNCLASSDIRAGQSLYLPPLPITSEPPPSPTSPPEQPTEEPTVEVPPWNLEVGAPNDPLPPLPADRDADEVELGERRYFFACEFTSTLTLATVTLSNGLTQQVEFESLENLSNLDIQVNVTNTKAAVTWPALPSQPTGVYTLTLTESSGSQKSLNFEVITPTQEHILTVPSVGPSGTVFQVYYVNFDVYTDASTMPTFEFWSEEPTLGQGSYELSYRRSWQVPITQPLAGVSGKGWEQVPLPVEAADLPAAYSVAFVYDGGKRYTLFWLR
jgi:LysM repeat protein